MNGNLPLWIVATQWVSRIILVVLFILSVWSVATMIRSWQLMKKADGNQLLFEVEVSKIRSWIEKKEWDQLKSWALSSDSIYSGTIQSILAVGNLGSLQVDRAVRSYLSLKKTQLENGLTILATLGSNAPFVGLFGTVLGIIQAFGIMGAHQNNTTDIMVGISEALVATAVGLFVAIPAVVAFNVLSRRLKVLMVNAESLRDLYLSLTQMGER